MASPALDALDAEFMSRLTKIQRQYVRLNKQLQVRVEKWCQALSEECTNDTWRRNRNAYADLLAVFVSSGELEEPFDRFPPTDGPLEKLPPHLVLRAQRTRGAPGGERKEVWQHIFAAAQRTRGALASRREGAAATVASAATAEDTREAPTYVASSQGCGGAALSSEGPLLSAEGSLCERCQSGVGEAAAAHTLRSTNEAAIEAAHLRLELGTLREELVATRAQAADALRACVAAEGRASENRSRAEQTIEKLTTERERFAAEVRQLRTALQEQKGLTEQEARRARELQEQKESEVLSLKRFHADQVLQLVRRQERYFAAATLQQQHAAAEAAGPLSTAADSGSRLGWTESPPQRRPAPPAQPAILGAVMGRAYTLGRVVAADSSAASSVATPSAAPPTPLSFVVSPPTPSTLGRGSSSARSEVVDGGSYDSDAASLVAGRAVPHAPLIRAKLEGPSTRSSPGLAMRAAPLRAGALRWDAERLQARLQGQLDVQSSVLRGHGYGVKNSYVSAAPAPPSAAGSESALDASVDASDCWRGQLDEYPDQSLSPDRGSSTPPRHPLSSVESGVLLEASLPPNNLSQRHRLPDQVEITSSESAARIEHVMAAASVTLQRSNTAVRAARSLVPQGLSPLADGNAAGYETNPAWNVAIVPLPF